jgi:hypothetical protein
MKSSQARGDRRVTDEGSAVMGLFQQMKDLKGVVAAAPEMISEAQQLQAAAQQYGVVTAGAAPVMGMPTATAIDPADPRLVPIEGVSIEMYARIAKVAAAGVDRASLVGYAAGLGISEQAWDSASFQWNERMRGDMPLAVHFGNLYRSVSV